MPTISKTGFKAHWKLNENAGQNRVDSAGLHSPASNLILVEDGGGTETSLAGKTYNQALTLNGGNNDGVTKGDEPIYNPGNIDFCFFGWIRPTSVSAQGFVVSKSGGTGSSAEQYSLNAQSSGTQLRWRCSGNGTAGQTTAIGFGLPLNVWSFFYAAHEASNDMVRLIACRC